MDMLDSLLRSHLTKADEKRAELSRAAEEKKQRLNPESAFNITNVDILDADTVRDRNTGMAIRVTGAAGNSIDSYETNPDVYKNAPAKEAVHRKSYADAYGLRPDQVSRDMLIEKGKLQKSQFAKRLESAADENGNIRYTPKGLDEYNRVLGEVSVNENTKQFLDESTNRFENAGYKGNYNFMRELEDFKSGDATQHTEGQGTRTWKDALIDDQAVNLTYGAGEMVNSLAQAAAIGVGAGKQTAEFFEGNREGLKDFKNKYGSEEMLRGERMAQKRSENRRAITSMKKAQYVADGDSEITAGVKAGVSEYGDIIQDFWQNPGRALDSAITSLPYMLGVGTAGSQAARIAGNQLRKTLAKDLAEFASRGKGVGALNKGQQAAVGDQVKKLMSTPAIRKEINDIVEKVGIGTVGLTEGMTNSADVYAEIVKMTEEEASQSHEYNKLRADGMSHEDALHELGVSAYVETLVATTVLATAAAAGTGAGAFEANMFRGFRKPPVTAQPVSRVVSTGKAGQGSGFAPKSGSKGYREGPGPRFVPKGAKVPDKVQPKAVKAEPKVGADLFKAANRAKKRQTAEELGLKKSLLASIASGTKTVGKGAGKLLKEPAKAGGKEFVEESLQSGGGELISQIASQEATGVEIGPGVGEATGEGGIVGFLSGFGMSSVTSSVKSLANKVISKEDGPDAATTQAVDINASTGNWARNGGATEAVDATIERKGYKAEKELDAAFKVLDADKTNQNIFDNYNAMERHFLEAIPLLAVAQKKAIAENDTKTIKKINDTINKAKHYEQVYQDGLRNTLKISTADYVNDKLSEAGVARFESIIEEASIRGVKIDPKIVEKLDQNSKNILFQNDEMNDLVRQLQNPEARAEAIAAEIAAMGVDPASEYGQELARTYAQVHDSKMGPGRFSLGGNTWVRGVQRYVRDLSGAMQEDPRLGRGHVAKILEQFNDFLKGQQNKINQLRGYVEKPDTVPADGRFQLHVNAAKAGTIDKSKKSYKFSQAGAERMLNALVAEQVTMEAVQNTFREKNTAYQQKLDGVEGVAPTVTPTAEIVPTGRLATLVVKFKAFSAKKLAAYVKDKSIKGAKDLKGSALVQFVAQWTLDLENNPEGSDTDPDDFVIPVGKYRDRVVTDMTTTELQDAKRLAAKRGDTATVTAINLVLDEQSAANTAARKKIIAPFQAAYKAADAAFNTAIKDFAVKYRKDNNLGRGGQGALPQSIINKPGLIIENNPILRDALYDETLDVAQFGPKYAEDGKKLLALYTAKEEALSALTKAQLTTLVAATGGRASAEPGAGTSTNTPAPGRETGEANAQAVYDNAVEQNPQINAEEIGEILAANRPPKGPESDGYRQRERALYKKHAEREKGPTDENIYTENYGNLQQALTAATVNAGRGPTATYADWFNYLDTLRDTLPAHMVDALRNQRTAATNALSRDTNVGVDTVALGNIFTQELENLAKAAEDLVNSTDMSDAEKAGAIANFTNIGVLEHIDPQAGLLVTNPENVEPSTTGPVGLNSVLFALRNNTRTKLTKTITAIKEELGDSGDAKLTRDLVVAEKGLKLLDNPGLNSRKLQELVSTIEQAVQERLTSEDAHRIANKPADYKNSLIYLAEMGSDGSKTQEFMDQRDALLESLLTMISEDKRNNVSTRATANKVTTQVWGFINKHRQTNTSLKATITELSAKLKNTNNEAEQAAIKLELQTAKTALKANGSLQNAFLAGGVRFQKGMGLDASGGTILQTTASLNLPTRLADSFTQAGDKGGSWLAIYPNWRTKIKDDYDRMYKPAEEMTVKEAALYEALGTFIRFEDKFRTTLLKTIPKWGPDSISIKSLWNYNSEFAAKRMLEDPSWFYRDQEGNLNENLITAMALETFNYVGGAGQRTAFNTPEEIASILKQHKGYTPNADETKALSTAGDGIENVYDLIGNKLMQHINIKGSGLSTGQLRSVMPRVLASRAVTTLIGMGLAKFNPVDMQEIQGKKPNKDEKRKFLRLAVEEETPNDLSTDFTWDVWNLNKQGSVLGQNNTLEKLFGTVAEGEKPSLVPFENVEKKVRKTAMVAPDESSTAAKADQDRPLGVNTVLQDATRLFPSGLEYLQVNHKYSATLEDVHHTKRENIKGRNRNFQREWNTAMEWLTQLNSLGAKEFYTANRNISNLRTMIINTFINTQASKVHRPLFPKAEAIMEYDINMTPESAKGNPEATAFYRSVAQKLGGKLKVEIGGKEVNVKVEFLTDEQVLDNVQALISDFKWQNLINHINDPQGTLDGRPVFDQTQIQHFLDAKLYDEENGETYMTLANLAALQKGEGTTVRMYAPVQTDATTSGFANSLLQLATNTEFDRVQISLRRVGASFRDDSTTATEYMANNPDSYQKITKLIRENMGRMLDGLTTSIDQKGNLQTKPIAVKLAELRTTLARVEEGEDSEFTDDPEGYARQVKRLRTQIRIYTMQSNERLLGFGTNTLGEIGGKQIGIIPELVEADNPNTVTGAGRQFAKDPFMLGNYNAGRTAAKLALASNSYSELMDLLSTMDDPATLQGAITELIMARNEAVPIMRESGDITVDQVKIIAEKDIAATVSDLIKSWQKDRTTLYAKQDLKFGEHETVNLGTLVNFPIAQQKVYRTIISDTYGEALHVALDSELFHLKRPRDAVHKMAFISNAIFQKLLDRRVKDFQKGNNNIYPDVTQIKYLVDQLVDENLFPGIPSALSKGLRDKIEAVKRESVALFIDGKKVRGEIGFEGAQQLTSELNDDGSPTTQDSLTMVIEDRGFKDDPGVAPAVRVIQSIEAVIQSDLLVEYAFTNTYDGQGAEGTLARLIGVSANESAIKRNYEYNMFDAMFGSMVSMLRVLHPTSNQVTDEVKTALLASLAKKYEKSGDTAQEAFDKVLAELKVVQDDIHLGRKRVWEEMQSLNNYMESNLSEVNVARVLETLPNIPTIYEKVNPTIEELTEAYNNHITNVDQNGVREDVKAKMTTALVTGISNGLTGENGAIDVLQKFMWANPNGNMIGLGYIMDLLKDALKKSGGNPNLTGLVNQLHTLVNATPDIRGIQIHLSEKLLIGPNGDNPNGMYSPRIGRNAARIDVYVAAPNFLTTTLHEIFHAITGSYIDNAELNNPDLFQEIVGQARALARSWLNTPTTTNPLQNLKNKIKANTGAILERHLERGTIQDQKNAVSEMISYVTTEFILNPDKKAPEVAEMIFLNEYDNVLKSLNLIVKMATPETTIENRQAQASAAKATAQQGLPLLHEGSTSEDIDTIAFLERYVTQLPAGQMRTVLDDVAKYETDPESLKHNQRLDFVIDNIIHPGMAAVDPLTVKISKNPDGTRNVGQVIGPTIYLEAAGNRLTSNIDMSMKEIVVHEYLHPIVRWALGQETVNGKRDVGHWDIQQRLAKLFNTARDQIKPLDLMPLAPTGDIVYAQQQARERYDYIFNNPNGDMSEFLINGLVNERLIELLADMDAPNTNQPVWEGASYQTLVNIMGRIMRLFTKKVNKSATGKVDKELQMLAKSIVGVNMQRMQSNLHKQRSQPRMDTLDGWLANQIGEKIAAPLKKHVQKFKPANTENSTKKATYAAVTLMLNATDEDFQQHANEYFRELGGQKNNALMEMAAELVPSQKGLMHWKQMLRKSNHIVDRARRSMIEHTQKAIIQHFDPSFRRKLRKADKEALTNVGMRADLSALLGTNNNWERLQRLVNSSAAVDAEIVSREAELTQISQGDVKLYNILHNQTMGLAELMIIGQTSRANQQQNPYMIANQNFFNDATNKRALADVDGAIKVIDELKTLYSLKLINNTAPQDMQKFADIVNHEMSRNISTPNGFQTYMSRHMNFKEQALQRSFKGNPAMMNSGYVYEQYNPDIDIKFTSQSPGDIKMMKDKGYYQVGKLPRDPRDPNQEPMIIWKGLNGHAMYSKTVVSPTDTEARGHDPFDSLRLLNGMNTNAAAILAKYDVNIMKTRNEADVLKQLNHPDVRGDVVRSVPIHNEKGEITNYRYMMSQNNKKSILESNQNFDYLLGRMFGSLEDREATIDINRKTAKLLYEEYQAGHGQDKSLRFVEISKYSKDPKAREMWDLLPTDMRRELTTLFGSEHFYIRDDAIKLILGFRKLSLAREEWFGKNTFAVRAAERIWLDVIKLLKIKIVLTMPDVVLGNMASNIAFLSGQGIPPEFITKETIQGLKGIGMWMKDEEALENLKQEMQATARSQGAATPRQRTKRAEIELNMANNPIAKLAQEGVFTGIADELEPDAWNWRNRIMQWVGEASDSFVPAAVVSAVKEVMIVPGAQTFKVALAATQYADFIARHVQYKYDTEVRNMESEEAIQLAIDNFIYYDVPQNEYQALAEDYGFSMFSKYFYRIQQQIFRLYKNHPVSATVTLAIQKMMTGFPFSSNVTDYAFLNNFDVTSRLHMFPWRTMDGADMLTPALLQVLTYPFGGDK